MIDDATFEIDSEVQARQSASLLVLFELFCCCPSFIAADFTIIAVIINSGEAFCMFSVAMLAIYIFCGVTNEGVKRQTLRATT